MIHALKAWTILVLEDVAGENVLLLHRSAEKKLLPNLVTGIGGRVELEKDEGQDIVASVLRELEEETSIVRDDVKNVKTRLVNIVVEQELTKVLYWLTGTLNKELEDFHSTEGELMWYSKNALPLAAMTSAAKESIPFILGLDEDDDKVYGGVLEVLPKEDRKLHIIEKNPSQ